MENCQFMGFTSELRVCYSRKDEEPISKIKQEKDQANPFKIKKNQLGGFNP